MGETSNATLMALYAEGDKSAFNELFARFEKRAFAYFLRRTGSEARAWDMYQELFMRVHRFRHTYDPAQAFAPWFFKIAQRVLIDDCRQPYRIRELALAECPAPVRQEDAEERAARRELAKLLLGALSSEQAHIVVAAKVHGMGYGQIADGLGKSVSSVKQVASRALRVLRAEGCVTDPTPHRRGSPG